MAAIAVQHHGRKRTTATKRQLTAGGESKDRYIGETKNQLRHGYGVYNYENRFFRYEGEWENGLKHGHGKLLLGDGGYYEGTFVKGEIEGHGYRVFGVSGRMYTGQFHRGEPDGQGLMRTPSGEQYEGEFRDGKREGFGTMTDKDGACYEGEFYSNRRHGDGLQEYPNGDQYKGDWVKGQRHGHGVLKCCNGTEYEGQWRGDVYHGEGAMSHCSGVLYSGLWTNGIPSGVAEEVRLTGGGGGGGGAREVVVVQGERFDILFECIDSTGSLTTHESGRSFNVSAAIRKKQSSSSHKQDTELLLTPYELLQFEQSTESSQGSSSQTTPSSDPNTPPPLGQPLQLGRLTNELYQLHSSSTHNLRESQVRSAASLPRRSSIGPPSSKSLHNLNEDDNTSLESYTLPLVSTTNGGKGAFRGLFLPPPILPLPQIKKKERATTSSRNLKEEERSSTVTPDGGHDTLTKELKSSSRQSVAVGKSKSLLSEEGSTAHDLGTISRASIRIQKEEKEEGGDEEKRTKGATCRSKMVKKLLQKRAKYCSAGTYIITVREVTDPPFLDRPSLKPLHIEVHVVSQKSKKGTTKANSFSNLLHNKSKPLQ